MTFDNQHPPPPDTPYNLEHHHPDGPWAAPPPAAVPSSLGQHPPFTHTVADGAGDVAVPTMPDQQQPAALDPTKEYHAEWGVMRDQDFHQLALKHQRDLESHHQSGVPIPDFYFWQANLGGYCMADMVQSTVVSSEGVFVLIRRMVEGAPHPGRRKKKKA